MSAEKDNGKQSKNQNKKSAKFGVRSAHTTPFVVVVYFVQVATIAVPPRIQLKLKRRERKTCATKRRVNIVMHLAIKITHCVDLNENKSVALTADSK